MKLHLLAVDDDPEALEAIQEVALDLCLSCKTFVDASQLLLELDAGAAPSLILIDLKLPGLDGAELMRKLAARKVAANIVVMSALPAKSKLLRTAEKLAVAHSLKIVDRLEKPFDRDDLSSMLKRLTGKPSFVKASTPNEEHRPIDISELNEGIASRQFTVYLQPKVNTKNLKCSGAEALVRWSHPTRGVLTPKDFVPLAESLGVIDRLTWQVIDRTLDALHSIQIAGLSLPSVSINLSLQCLSDIDLPERIEFCVKSRGLLTSSVVLEITESSLMKDERKSLEILLRLSLKGFRLSIDDFGTGFAMLSQLEDIPASELKVDMSFVKQLGRDRQADSIVEKSIELGHSFDMFVVAEGVESNSQLATLSNMGCDSIQGYLIAPPLAIDDFSNWLRKNSQVT